MGTRLADLLDPQHKAGSAGLPLRLKCYTEINASAALESHFEIFLAAANRSFDSGGLLSTQWGCLGHVRCSSPYIAENRWTHSFQ